MILRFKRRKRSKREQEQAKAKKKDLNSLGHCQLVANIIQR